MNPRDESRFRELGMSIPLSPAANRVYILINDAGGMTEAAFTLFPVLVSLQEQIEEAKRPIQIKKK